MTWVKICGITNLEDALTAVDAGADALGFVFYERSPRYVDPETAREIVAKLPVNIEKVGVFAGNRTRDPQGIAEHVRLTGIQLHVDSSSPSGDALFSSGPRASLKLYIALQARQFFDEAGRFDSFAISANGGRRASIGAVFLDSGTAQQPGGTGLALDWKKALPLSDVIKRAGFRLVIAGGLNPSNVAEPMHILRPFGVDVSSGVESSPGKKDPDKVRAFIAAVRHEDGRN